MFDITEEQVDRVLVIVGALVPLLSALSSWVNHVIRTKEAKSEAVSPALLGVGSVLNVLSVNLDKAVQLRNMMKGRAAPALPQETPPPVEEPPAPTPVLCAKCAAAALPVCSKCGEPVSP